jgi:hypothetical protein
MSWRNVLVASTPTGECSMKALIGAMLVAALITPAAADEFYVVRDSTTKKCMIVDKKPATSTTTVVSEGGKVYTTKTEAESAMKTVKVCSEM